MSLFYSASTGGFYDDKIHSDKQIPSDAVEITDEQHQVLLEGQSSGKLIKADDNGIPYGAEPPAPTADQLTASVRAKRDVLIASTDYLVMPDYPISAELLAKVKAYRQALRDVTEQSGFPVDIDWPVNPMDEVTA